MKGHSTSLLLAACAAMMTPAAARSAIDRIVAGSGGGIGQASGIEPMRPGISGSAPASARAPERAPMPPGGLECVPYARQLSGIRIFGDAHTWWGQAKGRYARGHVPRVGAVMAIRPFNNSRLGHVAAVSRIIDSRRILLSHANWSYRGRIERNVTAIDVSPENDWSSVRIWYAPASNLGTTHWPVAGFIYNARPGNLQDIGSARLEQVAADRRQPSSDRRRHRDPIGAIISGTY